MQSKVHVCIFGRVASSIILAKEYLMSALRGGHTIGARDVLQQYVNQEMRRGEH